MLGVITWHFKDIIYLLAYVDNFFIFSAAARRVDHKLKIAHFELDMASVGASFHEKQDSGNALNALGWDWESFPNAPSVMICTEDKFLTYCSFLKTWAAAKMISLQDAERAAGIMLFISAGFSIGRPDVAAVHLLKFRAKALRKCRRTCPSTILVPIDLEPKARSALSFWAEFFPKWNRRCEVYLDFGPTVSWQKLGRCDASTDWGCGGFYLDDRVLLGFAHKWSQNERDLAFVKECESTGVFEVLGPVHWFSFFDQFCGSMRVQLELDSTAAVTSLEAGWSKTSPMQALVRLVRERCFVNAIHLRSRHIKGAIFNKIADHLSHNRISGAQCCAREELGIELVMQREPVYCPAIPLATETLA
jgi:hypothetical protein